MTVDQDEIQRRYEEKILQKAREKRLAEREARRKTKEARDRAKAEAKAIQLAEEAEAEEKREMRTSERKRFLTPDLSRDDKVREATAREYYIKNAEGLPPTMADVPRRVTNLLGKVRYYDKQARDFERKALVEFYKSNQEESDALYAKHDEAVKEFLYNCYGIGVLYSKVIEEIGSPV